MKFFVLNFSNESKNFKMSSIKRDQHCTYYICLLFQLSVFISRMIMIMSSSNFAEFFLSFLKAPSLNFISYYLVVLVTD